MSDYKKIVGFTLGWEGGLVKDRDDKGGLTNKGLTYTTYMNICKTVFKVDPSMAHFNELTDEEIGLVIKYFWDIATNNNSITSQKVSEALFNWYWGSGKQGLIWFQRMITAEFQIKLLDDGDIGNKSTTAINSIDPDLLFKKAIAYRYIRFRKICKADPSQVKFVTGWNARLRKFALKNNDLDAYTSIDNLYKLNKLAI